MTRSVLLAIVFAALLNVAPARADGVDLPIEHEGTTDESPKYEELVKEGLSTVPAALRKKVVQAGFRVTLTPSLTWAEPGLAMVHRYGLLRPGEDVIGALCETGKHRLLIPEHSEDAAGKVRQHGRGVVGAVRHETGHAFDHAMGGISKGMLFKAAHEQDVAAMTPEMRLKHRYIVSGPRADGTPVATPAGRGECFASLFGALSTPAAQRGKKEQELFEQFPRSRSVVAMLDEEFRR